MAASHCAPRPAVSRVRAVRPDGRISALQRQPEDDSERVPRQRLFLRLLRPPSGGQARCGAPQASAVAELIPASHGESRNASAGAAPSARVISCSRLACLQITGDDESR